VTPSVGGIREFLVVAVILVVEDESTLLVLAESYLAEQGHKTFSASGVAEALAIIETDTDIDVLFTDIGLSHDGPQAGLDLAREAVERRPSLKLLYTTGQTVTDGMRELFVEGAALLEKPYTVEDLKKALSGLDIDPQPPLT
jgi:DNA-binding NtrC family response regulator